MTRLIVIGSVVQDRFEDVLVLDALLSAFSPVPVDEHPDPLGRFDDEGRDPYTESFEEESC